MAANLDGSIGQVATWYLGLPKVTQAIAARHRSGSRGTEGMESARVGFQARNTQDFSVGPIWGRYEVHIKP